MERCTVCKGQALSCDCEEEERAGHDPEKAKWTGEWPGVLECQEKGWYAIMDPTGKISTRSMGNWWPCTKDYPGAHEDLNRWSYFEQTGNDPHENTPVLGRESA